MIYKRNRSQIEEHDASRGYRLDEKPEMPQQPVLKESRMIQVEEWRAENYLQQIRDCRQEPRVNGLWLYTVRSFRIGYAHRLVKICVLVRVVFDFCDEGTMVVLRRLKLCLVKSRTEMVGGWERSPSFHNTKSIEPSRSKSMRPENH